MTDNSKTIPTVAIHVKAGVASAAEATMSAGVAIIVATMSAGAAIIIAATASVEAATMSAEAVATASAEAATMSVEAAVLRFFLARQFYERKKSLLCEKWGYAHLLCGKSRASTMFIPLPGPWLLVFHVPAN
jgi:hypothetical protein